MATHTFEGIVTDLKATLIYGHLPKRDILPKSAEEVAKEIEAIPENRQYSLKKRPYRWYHWDEDALFEYIALNVRGLYCTNKPNDCAGYYWSEAWLLKCRR